MAPNNRNENQIRNFPNAFLALEGCYQGFLSITPHRSKPSSTGLAIIIRLIPRQAIRKMAKFRRKMALP
jgi:hypothetical protein